MGTHTITKDHTDAYKDGDPRALHIEQALSRHGVSALDAKTRPSGKKFVRDVVGLYRNYADEPVTSRANLGDYVMQLGNAIVDWTMDVLGHMLRRGDIADRVVGPKMLAALSRVYQRATSMIDPEKIGQALGRSDLDMVLNVLPAPRIISSKADKDKGAMAEFVKMLTRLDTSVHSRIGTQMRHV